MAFYYENKLLSLYHSTYYFFSPATLNFTIIKIYPNTKSVTIDVYDDAISESNENVLLDIAAQCGALLGNNRYSLNIIDNKKNVSISMTI